jgi:cobalamin-dependent methionine synthase I
LLIIGERINTTREKVAEAVANQDAAFLVKEARLQKEAGADFIDLNVGTFGEEEGELLSWLVSLIQEEVDIPLSLDSPNPEAISSAIKFVKRKPIINSTTGEAWRLKPTISMAKEYSASVVALVIDEKGIPEDAQGRLKIAEKLIESLSGAGIPLEDIYLDPVVLPIATGRRGKVVLETIRLMRETFPKVHIICGLSNISFGLPLKGLLNRTFLPMAMAMGLDAVILDPLDKKLMAALAASYALLGEDRNLKGYLKAYRSGSLD